MMEVGRTEAPDEAMPEGVYYGGEGGDEERK